MKKSDLIIGFFSQKKTRDNNLLMAGAEHKRR